MIKKKKKKKRAKKPIGERHNGLVLSVLGKGYDVEVEGDIWRCRVRGRLFLKARATRPVVGDKVCVEKAPDEELRGIICGIDERTSLLSRRFPEIGGEQAIAANIDQVLICVAVKNPPFRHGLVDRYLVTCEALSVKPLITLNKVDLISEEKLKILVEEFSSLGYEVLCTSAKEERGIEELREALNGKRTVFTGPSGAGKSSLLNCTDPSLKLMTGEVNLVTGRGRHTTTVSRLIRVADGYVMDTPGIREFAPWGITQEGLAELFIEFRSYLGHCHFRDCTHVNEPRCAIKDAVESGEIVKRRYESYVQLWKELAEELEKRSY